MVRCAASASALLAGNSDEITRPAPKATSPAPSGLPCTWLCVDETADRAESFAPSTAPLAAPVLVEVTESFAPMTRSRTDPRRSLVAALRRWTIADGLTRSWRASTSEAIR
jgi:hypothetical protein